MTTRLTMLDGVDGALTFGSNHVVDFSRRIVFERAMSEYDKEFTFRDLRVWRTSLERPRRVKGSVAYLSNTGVHNLGHWLLFIYPLVRYYQEYLGTDPDYFYIGKPAQEFHYASLAEIGVDPSRVLTEAVVGDRMLAALADDHIPPPSSFLDFSTSTLRLPRDPTSASRRVFISRALRPTRTLINEPECEEMLVRRGFRTYYTENLTLREERELFASADVVVAVHGAGLANLLFCQPGCVVVELFPHGYKDAWFAEVSAARRLKYACLSGEPTDVRGLRPIHYPVDMNVAKLEAVLSAAIEAADRLHPPADETAASRGGGILGR